MVQRVLIGKFPDGDSSQYGYGLRISKPGYDVKVANPDNEKLVFNSDWQNILAIATNSDGSLKVQGINASSPNTVYYYDHNLNHIPFIAAFINIDGQGWEHYHSSNMLLSKYVQMDKWAGESVQQYWFSNQNDLRAYAYDGNVATKVQIKVTKTQVTCLCSKPAKFYIIVYKAKAFDG
jgi:hypothetical protein